MSSSPGGQALEGSSADAVHLLGSTGRCHPMSHHSTSSLPDQHGDTGPSQAAIAHGYNSSLAAQDQLNNSSHTRSQSPAVSDHSSHTSSNGQEGRTTFGCSSSTPAGGHVPSCCTPTSNGCGESGGPFVLDMNSIISSAPLISTAPQGPLKPAQQGPSPEPPSGIIRITSITVDGTSAKLAEAGGDAAAGGSAPVGGSAGSKWRIKAAYVSNKVRATGRKLMKKVAGDRSDRSDAQPVPPAAEANVHLLGFSGSTNRSQSLVRTRIEPKTFFANERTFLAWLHIGVLVLMTGLGLLTGSTIMMPEDQQHAGSCSKNALCQAMRIAGACIAPVAILMMAYALYVYKKRAAQILRRETVRYDDQRGPVALVLLLVAVALVCVSLALASTWAMIRT